MIVVAEYLCCVGFVWGIVEAATGRRGDSVIGVVVVSSLCLFALINIERLR